jgi:integrase
MNHGCPPLSPQQLRTTLRLLKGRYRWRDRALVILGVRSGLRISELLSLRVSDAVAGATPRDRIYLKRKNSKGRHQGASIILLPQAAAAITKWLSVRGTVAPDDWLFPSQKRTHLPLDRKSAWVFLHRAFIHTGVSGMAGSHCLRKSYCRNVYTALRGDIFRLSVAMRHTSPLTTISYLSFRQEEIDRAILRA